MPKVEDCYDLEIYKKANLPSFKEFIEKEVDPVFPRTMTFEEYKAKAEEIDGKLPKDE